MSSRMSSTRDSYHRNFERTRSPSPSDYYRDQLNSSDQIFNRIEDLNFFIQKGIEKFLDKQAVRDLIYEYDINDIFVGGEENFYNSLFDDEEFFVDGDKSDIPKSRFHNIVQMFNSLDVKQLNNIKRNVKAKPTAKKAEVTMNGNSSWKDLNTTNKLNDLMATIWVKLFGIKTNHKKRRESEFLESNFP